MSSYNKTDMTQGPITRQLVLFSIPVIVGNVFQQFYSMVDTAVVGKFVGSDALGAMGASGPLIFFLNTIIIGLAMGVSVVAAQLFGAKNYEKLKRTIYLAIIFGIIFGVVLTFVGVFYSKEMMVLMGSPVELIEGANIYLKYMFGGLIINVAYNMMSGIMRALGDSKTPLYALIIASVLNVVLDLYFVIHLDMGIAGVAIATLISQFISLVICIPIFMKRFAFLKFSREDMVFEKSLAKNIIRIMVPTTLQYALTAGGFVIQQYSLNAFGADVVSGNTAATKVEQIFTTMFFALGSVAASFAGQNLGALKPERIKEGIKKLTKFSCLLSVAVSGIVFFFGKYIVLLFVNKSDISVYQTAMEYTHIISIFFLPLALMHLYVALVRSLNEPIIPMVSGIIEVGCRAIIGLSAVFIFKNYYIIWLAAPLAWILTDPMVILKYRNIIKKIPG